MAISAGRQLVKGSDIMLFVYDSTAASYKSIAHASSHSLSISADVETIDTKDTGKWGMNEVNKINWEIQCDHFYTSDGYETFFDLMMAGQPIKVAFGLKKETTPETVNVDADGNWTTDKTVSPLPYVGNAIITSLDWTADAGSKSTFSATLQGQGELNKIPTT